MAPQLHQEVAGSAALRRLRLSGRTRRRWPRALAASVLVTTCLFLSGCVYLRLLEFKHQLADFDRFLTLQTDDGLRLGCLAPVVLAEDFRWLGVTPEKITRLEHSELWHIRWAKQLPPGAKQSDARDIEMELIFTEGKFTRLYLPESTFVFVPKSFFTGLLRGLGQAGVDRGRRLAEVNFTRSEREAVTARVVATSLAMLLGAPTEHNVEGSRTTLRYRYTPVPADSRQGLFDLYFTFDTVTGQLQRLHGRSPVGEISFNFEPQPLAAPAPVP